MLPPMISATPIGSRWISSSMPACSPSTEDDMAFRSLGLVTLSIIWVLHWDSTFLSILAALWEIMVSPRPNLRPSAAMVRNILEQEVVPCWGQKLCASSAMIIIGGILPSFLSSNMAVARRVTISSWMSGGVPFRLMMVVFPWVMSSSILVPCGAKMLTSFRYASSAISVWLLASSSDSSMPIMSLRP